MWILYGWTSRCEQIARFLPLSSHMPFRKQKLSIQYCMTNLWSKIIFNAWKYTKNRDQVILKIKQLKFIWEFNNLTGSLKMITEIYSILRSKLHRRKMVCVCFFHIINTRSNTSAKHFWRKAMKRIKTSFEWIKVNWGTEGIEHLREFFILC